MTNLPVHPGWNNVTEKAKDFVQNLVVNDPEKRLSATEALQHRWLAKPSHFEYLSTVYCFAINGWQARPRDHHDLVEELDLCTVGNPRKSLTPPISPPGKSVTKAGTLFQDEIHSPGQSHGFEELTLQRDHPKSKSMTPKVNVIDDPQAQDNCIQPIAEAVKLSDINESISNEMIQGAVCKDGESYDFPRSESIPTGAETTMTDDQTHRVIPVERVKAFILGENQKLKRPVGPQTETNLNASPLSSFTDSILESPPRPRQITVSPKPAGFERFFNPNQLGLKESGEHKTQRNRSKSSKVTKEPEHPIHFRKFDPRAFKVVTSRDAPFHGDGFDGYIAHRNHRMSLRSATVSKFNSKVTNSARTPRFKDDIMCLEHIRE
jgi:serine/threonine protein kinase